MDNKNKFFWVRAVIRRLGITNPQEQEDLWEIAKACSKPISFFNCVKNLYGLSPSEPIEKEQEQERTQLVEYENNTLSPISQTALRELDKDD